MATFDRVVFTKASEAVAYAKSHGGVVLGQPARQFSAGDAFVAWWNSFPMGEQKRMAGVAGVSSDPAYGDFERDFSPEEQEKIRRVWGRAPRQMSAGETTGAFIVVPADQVAAWPDWHAVQFGRESWFDRMRGDVQKLRSLLGEGNWTDEGTDAESGGVIFRVKNNGDRLKVEAAGAREGIYTTANGARVMGYVFDGSGGRQFSAGDQLPGGVADNARPMEFDQEQLAAGIQVELEHTDDVSVAAEIAMDHLREDADYYRKLATIEPDAAKAEAAAD